MWSSVPPQFQQGLLYEHQCGILNCWLVVSLVGAVVSRRAGCRVLFRPRDVLGLLILVETGDGEMWGAPGRMMAFHT